MWNGKQSPPYAQQLSGVRTVAVAAGEVAIEDETGGMSCGSTESKKTKSWTGV